MTQDELFTAIYLVCGALPSKPEKLKDERRYATMYRRNLGGGKWESWMVDDASEYEANYDLRTIMDPSYMRYFNKAAPIIEGYLRSIMTSHRGGSMRTMALSAFSQYLAWMESRGHAGT